MAVAPSYNFIEYRRQQMQPGAGGRDGRRVRSMVQRVVVAIVALLVGAPAFAQGPVTTYCRVSYAPGSGARTQESLATMTVVAGQPCFWAGPTTVTRTMLTPPRSGSVTFPANGGLSYQPRAGFVGRDVFVYEIAEPANAAMPRRTVTMNITVQREPLQTAAAPAKPAPSAAPNAAANAAPAPSAWPGCSIDSFTVGAPATGMANPTWNSNAANPTMRLRAGGSCSFTMTGPGGSMTITGQPRSGSASVDNNRITYRASPGFNGSDAFTVRIFHPGVSPQFATRYIYVDVEVR